MSHPIKVPSATSFKVRVMAAIIRLYNRTGTMCRQKNDTLIMYSYPHITVDSNTALIGCVDLVQKKGNGIIIVRRNVRSFK